MWNKIQISHTVKIELGSQSMADSDDRLRIRHGFPQGI